MHRRPAELVAVFGKVYHVAPVDRLSVVFAIVFAVLFLGERLSLVSSISIGLIAVGAIMVVPR